MHRPESDEALQRARRRMAFEEFFVLELAMALRRRHLLDRFEGRRLPASLEIDRRIRARFPFQLTDDQNRAIREIATDLDSGRPMTRLLQGDVGSGKTVVALYACLLAVAHKRQAAIMAPTEILAAQHFRSIETYLAGSRVRRTLLRGKLGRKARGEALAAIEAGEIDLVVGTQALLERDVAFRDLALVVVDEQHKFGVLQRVEFRTKGPQPHCLVMTATPIPRTLAMTVFGDLDVSVIESSPPGRGSVSTFVVAPRQWASVMRRVREKIEAGEQAYVVCPLIGDADGSGDDPAGGSRDAASKSDAGGVAEAADKPRAKLASAIEVYERLTQGPWRGLKIGLLHGALPPEEKQRVIQAFAAGELQAIVSTTVVEVGVDVPNASIMVIENADRFGLSQLHQLRGRIGRGSRDATCVLIARSRGAKARERLETLARETNGFRIAEADLRLRGPGELLGTRQSGLPELRFGDLVQDFELLESARRDAFALVGQDPHLKRPEHAGLRLELQRMFRGRLALLDAG
ncbi:MAG: ATP-dependent DNA helicase RecG [Planctomycetota bacterium]|nr:MAG: ATP-dependent DNA helicase RecG [Planctomycetota bacterium]